MSNSTYIDAGKQDMSRPSERPKKTNWKTGLTKSFLKVYQYINSTRVAEIIWGYFTKPIQPRFTASQEEIMDQAQKGVMKYKGFNLTTYKWGNGSKKVLLSHGWNSKIADFRRMINQFVANGYSVEGIDMKAHGKSEGIRSVLPEFRDVLKQYILQQGKFEALVGYSLGGIAAGITTHELSEDLRPDQLFLIATPPYTRYFFEHVVKNDAGCNHEIYVKLVDMMEEHFGESIDYFDLRDKKEVLSNIEMHLIYDEDDQTVPFSKGEEMRSHFPTAHWVHTKGLGHYKVIAYHEVIQYISNAMKKRDVVKV